MSLERTFSGDLSDITESETESGSGKLMFSHYDIILHDYWTVTAPIHQKEGTSSMSLIYTFLLFSTFCSSWCKKEEKFWILDQD